ncbi:18 kDa learning-associated protein of slug-like isoform X1 [Gigantopelta aegis]|uniref:18 kDa learning-associated protein of slug-like isoform X1 n=1 Tax=Gigantopelta aegis TaxID=1735272 RepID=UPI001B887555|nr:18 kDa learning-associated protein of slug-like isoform X1 [Gigantopelta aegis]
MAKSMRSKKRRKMRNQKRIKWAPKVNARMQRIAEALNSKDIDITQLVTVKTVSEIKKSETKEKTDVKTVSEIKNSETKEKTDDAHMDVDVEVKSRDAKTLKDEDGHYPVWMNQRAVKKHRQKINKIKRVKKKGRNKRGAW